MNDTQKLHLLGTKYWPLLSRQKWISSREQKEEEVGNTTKGSRRASHGEEKPKRSVSALFFGAVEADGQQNYGF